jgi:hypothetical protein
MSEGTLCEQLQFWTNRHNAPQCIAADVKEKFGTLPYPFFASSGRGLRLKNDAIGRPCSAAGKAPGLGLKSFRPCIPTLWRIIEKCVPCSRTKTQDARVWTLLERSTEVFDGCCTMIEHGLNWNYHLFPGEISAVVPTNHYLKPGPSVRAADGTAS